MATAADRMGDLKDEAVDAAKDAGREGVSEIRSFMQDVEELLARVTHLKDADVARIRARLESSMHSARDAMSRGTQRVRQSTVAAAEHADDYVREQPWKAIGIAAIAGLAIGAVLSRR
jgi:ElaB/YqjD/DUF883 family membrane-anchored ribosome-binding protein